MPYFIQTSIAIISQAMRIAYVESLPSYYIVMHASFMLFPYYAKIWISTFKHISSYLWVGMDKKRGCTFKYISSY